MAPMRRPGLRMVEALNWASTLFRTPKAGRKTSSRCFLPGFRLQESLGRGLSRDFPFVRSSENRAPHTGNFLSRIEHNCSTVVGMHDLHFVFCSVFGK